MKSVTSVEFLKTLGYNVESKSILETRLRTGTPSVTINRVGGSQSYRFVFNSVARDIFNLAKYDSAIIFSQKEELFVSLLETVVSESVVGANTFSKHYRPAKNGQRTLQQCQTSASAFLFTIPTDTTPNNSFKEAYSVTPVKQDGNVLVLKVDTNNPVKDAKLSNTWKNIKTV